MSTDAFAPVGGSDAAGAHLWSPAALKQTHSVAAGSTSAGDDAAWQISVLQAARAVLLKKAAAAAAAGASASKFESDLLAVDAALQGLAASHAASQTPRVAPQPDALSMSQLVGVTPAKPQSAVSAAGWVWGAVSHISEAGEDPSGSPMAALLRKMTPARRLSDSAAPAEPQQQHSISVPYTPLQHVFSPASDPVGVAAGVQTPAAPQHVQASPAVPLAQAPLFGSASYVALARGAAVDPLPPSPAPLVFGHYPSPSGLPVPLGRISELLAASGCSDALDMLASDPVGREFASPATAAPALSLAAPQTQEPAEDDAATALSLSLAVSPDSTADEEADALSPPVSSEAIEVVMPRVEDAAAAAMDGEDSRIVMEADSLEVPGTSAEAEAANTPDVYALNTSVCDVLKRGVSILDTTAEAPVVEAPPAQAALQAVEAAPCTPPRSPAAAQARASGSVAAVATHSPSLSPSLLRRMLVGGLMQGPATAAPATPPPPTSQAAASASAELLMMSPMECAAGDAPYIFVDETQFGRAGGAGRSPAPPAPVSAVAQAGAPLARRLLFAEPEAVAEAPRHAAAPLNVPAPVAAPAAATATPRRSSPSALRAHEPWPGRGSPALSLTDFSRGLARLSSSSSATSSSSSSVTSSAASSAAASPSPAATRSAAGRLFFSPPTQQPSSPAAATPLAAAAANLASRLPSPRAMGSASGPVRALAGRCSPWSPAVVAAASASSGSSSPSRLPAPRASPATATTSPRSNRFSLLSRGGGAGSSGDAGVARRLWTEDASAAAAGAEGAAHASASPSPPPPPPPLLHSVSELVPVPQETNSSSGKRLASAAAPPASPPPAAASHFPPFVAPSPERAAEMLQASHIAARRRAKAQAKMLRRSARGGAGSGGPSPSSSPVSLMAPLLVSSPPPSARLTAAAAAAAEAAASSSASAPAFASPVRAVGTRGSSARLGIAAGGPASRRRVEVLSPEK